jgi:hypothetical protein
MALTSLVLVSVVRQVTLRKLYKTLSICQISLDFVASIYTVTCYDMTKTTLILVDPIENDGEHIFCVTCLDVPLGGRRQRLALNTTGQHNSSHIRSIHRIVFALGAKSST